MAEYEIVTRNSDAGFGNLILPDEQVQQEVPQDVAPIQAEAPQVPVEAPIETPVVTLTPEYQAPQAPAEPVDYWKELGVDEDGRKVLEAYKQGKLDEFVSIKNTNYDVIPDEELLRLDIKNKYPTLSQEEQSRLYNKKLKSYGFDEFADDDAILDSKILLKADMQSIRDGLKQKQSEYQIGEYKAPSQVNEEAKAQQMQFENYINTLPAFKQFETDRTVKLTEGLNFIAPQSLDVRKEAVNPDAFLGRFWNADGSFKADKWAAVVNYAENAEMVIKTAVDYGKSLGRKENDDLLRNPSSSAPANAPVEQPKYVITRW